MIKSVLVVGGSGFLGKSILHALLRAGCANLACADRTPSAIQGVKNYETDILNYDSVERAIQGYDVVINCVGQITSPIHKCVQLNSLGVTNLAKAAARTSSRVIHISTVSVYGTVERATEESPLNPETPYATCKAYAEFILQQHLDPTRLTILRLSNLFSETQPKGILAYLQKSYHTQEELTFNNNGDLRRYYLHVDDCAKVITLAVEQESLPGTYNLIGNEQYTIKELIELLEQKTKRNFKVTFEAVPPLENVTHIADTKIHKALQISYQKSIQLLFTELAK